MATSDLSTAVFFSTVLAVDFYKIRKGWFTSSDPRVVNQTFSHLRHVEKLGESVCTLYPWLLEKSLQN